MTTDALSAVGQSTAKLKFATWFGSGVTLGALSKSSSSLYLQDITGTDALTGFKFPDDLQAFMGSVTNSQIWLIPDPKSPDYTTGTISSHIDAVLQASTAPQGPAGARELYLPVHTRNSATGTNSKPQIIVMIRRDGTSGLPPSDVLETYVTAWHFIPANLDTLLDVAYGSNFYVLKDYKTGGWTGGSAIGDFRIRLLIVRATAGQPLYYKFAADNNANGNWDGSASTSIPSVGSIQEYWSKLTAEGSVNADLGYWVRSHLWIKLAPTINTRSSVTEAGAKLTGGERYEQNITDGIAYAAIENPATGRWLTVGSQVGGRMRGNENLPWTRRMEATEYCSATSASDPIVYAKTTGIHIWDKPNIWLP